MPAGPSIRHRQLRTERRPIFGSDAELVDTTVYPDANAIPINGQQTPTPA